MFTRPRNCCLFVSLRVATFILAFLQTASFTFQAYLLQQYSADNWTFFVSILCGVFSIAGLMGMVGVYKRDPKFVRRFAFYYWIEFALVLISHLVFIVASVYSPSTFCHQLASDYQTMKVCSQDFLGFYLVFIALIAVNTLIRLHFGFSIWAYFRQLEAESKAKLEVVDAKVIYPQYIFVDLSEKPSTSQA